MKITGQFEEHAVLKYQRQNETTANKAENQKNSSVAEQGDQVSINTRSAKSDEVLEAGQPAGELVGNLTNQIKDYSLKASRSHANVDPGMVISLFRE